MAARLDSAAQILQRRTDTIECWDDDPDFAELTQIQRPPPVPSALPRAGTTDFGHRESTVSSRRSTITSSYDLDALEAADREHQIPFDGSPAAAIKSAQSAGIPIPENVPLSALVGGTIKRLGPSKRAKKVTMHDDWGEDLEFPTMENAFTVKMKEFPASLQHVPVSRGFRSISPTRFNLAPVTDASVQLNKFRDTTDDELFFGDCDDFPTLKGLPATARQLIPERKSTPKTIFPTPPVSELSFKPPASIADDDFENDFEFPADVPLQLGLRGAERPRQPDVQSLDLGFEDWGDGDSGLGSSYAGTRAGMERGAHSVISPSISAMTMESEDDLPFEGLILPDGMLPDLQRLLEKRRQAAAVEPPPPEPEPEYHALKHTDDPEDEEFFEGLEIGEGDVFDSMKLSLNRNIQQKESPRKPSPIRRTAMSLTFTTNKPLAHQPSTRLNRLSQAHPTLLPSAPLEPVVERESQNQRENQRGNQREGQPSTAKRNRNRWSGGPAVSDYRWSAGDNSTPSAVPQRTERRTALNKSARSLRGENVPPPTTTHAQLVKAKRSMPNIKDSPGSPQRTPRPPSRASNNGNGRPSSRASNSGRPPSNSNANAARSSSSGGRPPSRTSSGRPQSRTENPNSRSKNPHANIGAVRHPAPFIPGGSSVRNSQHASAKASKQTLDGRQATAERPNSRAQGRITPRHSPSSSGASNTTAKKTTPIVAPEHLRQEAAKIGTLTQPTRKRNFGDGTELETFDDLPTSAKIENQFTVTPVGRGAPKVLRAKSLTSREGESSKKKKQDTTPRQDDVPRFARDTTASRKAREITQQRLGLMAAAPSSPNVERWRTKLASRNPAPRAPARKPQAKPHLIKPMGNITTLAKENAANGMVYNPRTFRWEGNEKDLRAFDVPEHRTPPRPALITKVNQSGSKMGIQVVGGMVFDPSRMCWLKVDEDPDDEDDPFEGLDDLPEDIMSIDGQSAAGVHTTSNSVVMSGVGGPFGAASRISGGFGEFVVGEEFDVGPEFLRRQREEEDRWRKGTEGWITPDAAKRENRYLILQAETR